MEFFLFLVGDSVDANIELLNLFRDVLVVLNKRFLNALKHFLVACNPPHNDRLSFLKLGEEFAEVGS